MAKVRTRKRGKTYSYIFEAGREDGKRKVIEKGGFDTEDIAYDAGVEAYNKYLHGNLVSDSKTILREFLNNWLKMHSNDVKPNTVSAYETLIKYRINPVLGDYKICDLKPMIIDKWAQSLINFSKSQIKGSMMVLKQALDYAVYPAQILNDNPAKYIKIPKSISKKHVERFIIPFDDIKKITDDIYPVGHKYHLPIMIAYYTGMRLSEVLGLTWDNIDFKAGMISIDKQIQVSGVGSNRRTYLTTPKTKTSKRSILISKILIKEIKKWKTIQLENKLKLGESYILTCLSKNNSIILKQKRDIANDKYLDLVCTCSDGMYIIANSVKGISKTLEHHGINFNFHSLRHTHATLLIENNAKIKDVAARLGHSQTSSLTEDLYTHDTLEMQKETVAILDKINADK